MRGGKGVVATIFTIGIDDQRAIGYLVLPQTLLSQVAARIGRAIQKGSASLALLRTWGQV